MMKKYRASFLRLLKILNVLAITGTFANVWLNYYSSHTLIPFDYIGNIVVILGFLILYYIFLRVYEGFFVEYHKVIHLIYSQVLSVLVTDAFLYAIICLFSYRLAYFIPGLIMFFWQAVIIVVWSIFAKRFYFFVTDRRKAAVIWDMRTDILNLVSEYYYNKNYEVVYGVNIRQVDYSLLDQVDAVFLMGVQSHDRNGIIKYCIDHRIVAYVIPRVGDVMMQAAERINILHLPVLKLARYAPSGEYLFIKRVCDIVISLIGIIIFSPIMVVVALLIRRDGGPAFYKQVRLTKDEKEFELLKFRSMRVDAEKDGIARLSTGVNDDRITKVGHVIRAIRFDELPQLFNILKGDMSIVGPRPERPEIAEQYYEVL
ncbi:MAG: sugar transferase, partial [Erysipelotrichaceae bacterium]|nr:sugar transferase [Erysipelotrichaceae bacterium]